MVLEKLAMVRPSDEYIYAPSRITAAKRMDAEEFLAEYADTARVIDVSFEEDGVSNPQPVTAYGRGLDCWWMVSVW
jgi:hypothetical protein